MRLSSFPLSFSFAMLLCFEQIRFVEGLLSSTRAKTLLRLTFAASFLFHSSSAFLSAGLFLRYRNAICLEISAGTLICSARLLDFIGVTLLVMILLSLSFGS